MADGTFPTLVSKDRLPNLVTNPIFVQLTNGTSAGIDPGTGATDLGKAEDSAHASGDVGVQLLAVRNDTLAALAGTDGDYAPLQVDADGALYVTGTISTSPTYDYAEDSAHTTGDVGAFILAVRNDTLASLTSTDGDYAALQVDADGALYVTIRDGGNSITVDGTVAATQSGTWTVDLGATDNAVLDAIAASLVDIETNTDFGAVVGGGTEAAALRVTIANDSTGVLSVDDNGGSLTVDGTVTLGANSGVDIGDVDVTSVIPGTGATNLGKAEDAVHASGDVGVMFLAVRQDTQSNLGADGDYVPPTVNAFGELRVTTSSENFQTDEFKDYFKHDSIASDTSSNHTHTVGATGSLWKGYSIGASGGAKFEFQTSNDNISFTTFDVQYIPRQGGSKTAEFPQWVEQLIATAGRLRIVATNRQGVAMDMHSTMYGRDIA